MDMFHKLDVASSMQRAEREAEENDVFADLPEFTPQKQRERDVRGLTIEQLGFDVKKFENRVKLHYRIEDKYSGALMPWGPLLRACPPQLRLVKLILRLCKKGGPVRILVLKNRKVGISTAAVCTGLEFAMQLPWTFGIIAHQEDSTDALFNIARTAYENMDASERPETRSIRDNLIAFGERKLQKRLSEGVLGHKGKVMSATAGGKYPFSGKTIQYLAMSECAKWDAVGDEEAQQRFILSAMGSVPKVGPSVVIAESTGNGMQGWFWQQWVRAEANRAAADGSRWYPYFVSWIDDPACVAVVPQGFDWTDHDPDDLAKEKELVEKYSAGPEQLMFRRNMIFNEMNNDADLFDQEFPTTSDVAFLAAGRQGIAKRTLDRHSAAAEDPVATYGLRAGEEEIVPLTVTTDAT